MATNNRCDMYQETAVPIDRHSAFFFFSVCRIHIFDMSFVLVTTDQFTSCYFCYSYCPCPFDNSF